jgi:LacI family transcriptional regulator
VNAHDHLNHPMIEDKKIKIKDVAEIAGVSVGTVDRVMHNRGEVAEETRKKVLKAIKKLRYTPNMIARSLALKKEFKFAALLPDANQNDYWHGPLEGLRKASVELQTYKLKIDTYLFAQSDPASFEQKATEMVLSKPDGIIFPPLYEEISRRLIGKCKEFGIPFSLIDSDLEEQGKISFIGQNSFQSGFLVGKLMYRLVGTEPGKIVILLMDEGSKKSNQVKRRIEGFMDYVEKCACMPDDKVQTLILEGKSRNDLKLMIKEYFKQKDISGIFIPNSRAYLLCELADDELINGTCIIGYDLLKKNIEYLECDRIDFLIAQNPTKQGYQAVIDLFEHIVFRKKVKKESFIPIDIIMKENYKFYI